MSSTTRWGAAIGAGLLGIALLGTPALAGPEQRNGNQNSSESAASDSAPGRADRETEAGGSGTQGRSDSNPDGGGVDKPYPADGQPAESQGNGDFDGNNGCGNDADFADDNNGNCGGNRDKERPSKAPGRPGGEQTNEVSEDADPSDAGGAIEEPPTSNTATENGTVTAGVVQNSVSAPLPESAADAMDAANTAVLGVGTTRSATAADRETSAEVLGVTLERAPAAAAPAGGSGGALGNLRGRVSERLATTGPGQWLLALAATGMLLVLGGLATRRIVRT